MSLGSQLARVGFTLAICLAGVVACAHLPLCQAAGEAYPDKPFDLAVRIGSEKAVIGSRLHVEYVLTNTSAVAVGACPLDWDEHHFIGTTGNRGLVHTSTGAAPETNVVRLPAGTSLVWAREVDVPDVGVGAAKFIGIFNSWCPLWSGKVMSKTVELILVSSSSAMGG